MSLTGDLSFNSVASVSVSQHKGRIFWRWGPHLLYNTNQLGNLFSKFLAAFKMIGLNGFSIVIYFELFYSVFEVKKKKKTLSAGGKMYFLKSRIESLQVMDQYPLLNLIGKFTLTWLWSWNYEITDLHTLAWHHELKYTCRTQTLISLMATNVEKQLTSRCALLKWWTKKIKYYCKHIYLHKK